MRHRLGRCAKRKKDEVSNQAEKIAVSRSVGDAGQRNRDSGRGNTLVLCSLMQCVGGDMDPCGETTDTVCFAEGLIVGAEPITEEQEQEQQCDAPLD